MLSALHFSIFLVSFFTEHFLFISFQQKNEIKKGNTLMEFKYLLFCSSIETSMPENRDPTKTGKPGPGTLQKPENRDPSGTLQETGKPRPLRTLADPT